MNKKLLMTSFVAACTLGAFTLSAADDKPAAPKKQEQRQKGGAPKVNMKGLEEAARAAVEQFNAENNDANRAKMNEAVGALTDARLKAAVEKNQKEAERLKERMNNREKEIEDAIKNLNKPKKEKSEVILFNDTFQGKEGDKKVQEKKSNEPRKVMKGLTEAERKDAGELTAKLMKSGVATDAGKADLAKLNGIYAKALARVEGDLAKAKADSAEAKELTAAKTALTARVAETKDATAFAESLKKLPQRPGVKK